MHDGTYTGAVTITKSLKLLPFPNEVAIVDAGCAAPASVTVAASRVAIRNDRGGTINSGFHVQDSANGAALGAARIVLSSNSLFGGTPQRGFLIENSDGIRIVRNQIFSNPPVSVELDSTSDNNLMLGNTFQQPILDSGTGNCGARNDVPVPPCN